MVIDSSALLSIYLREPKHETFFEKIARSTIAVIGAPTLLEVTMVLSARTGRDARGEIARSLRRLQIQVIPFTGEHFEVAAEAFHRYGKARHPAALNFGDCMSYAVAAVSGLPLLYIGKDFARTDIPAA